MEDKALVIKVDSNSLQHGVRNAWSELGNRGSFIRDIVTPELSNNANTGNLVSGIPTAFARVDLFKSALDAFNSNDTEREAKNLLSYYKDLISEWRGLIACIGLDYPNIKAKRINLVYSDGKTIEQTSNIYEPAGAFGNMLLKRKARWCEQNLPDNEKAVPFLDIIKYRNQVVGATAPESLLFTSTGYRIDDSVKKPWIDVHTRKFIDPLKSDLSEVDLKTLYAYVSHIVNHLPEIESYYNGLGVKYASLKKNLEDWLVEMVEYSDTHGHSIKGGTVPPVDAGFSKPFAFIIKYKDWLYGKGGGISEEPTEDDQVGFDPKSLLLPPESKITQITLQPEYTSKPEKLQELPVFLLTASIEGNPEEKAYFALPLSAQGLNVFGNSIRALVDDSGFPSKLTATYNPSMEEDNLEVKLSIRTENGNLRSYCKRYTVGVDPKMLNKDILMWPNFVSKQWKQYYLYSELPHNSNQGVSAFPFVGDVDDKHFSIYTNKDMTPILLAQNGRITAPKETVTAELLIKSDHAVADNDYKYEIYRSDKPFKGVRLKSPTGEEGGYLFINYSNSENTQLPRNMLEKTSNLNRVTVGIDFGSTNTSVAYSLNSDGKEKDFEFHNLRVSLLGQEKKGVKAGLQENRILFFQGPDKPRQGNELHSVLTVHDERRLGDKDPQMSTLSQLSHAVQGGFPCFMDNLPVEHVSEDIITLKYPNIGQVQQIHNMKWTTLAKDNAHKMAYLSSLLLHIYAELFLKNMVPDKLRWSFPSAMSTQLLSKYTEIWSSLEKEKPDVLDHDGLHVDLKVSQYSAPVRIEDDAQKDQTSDRRRRREDVGGAAAPQQEVPQQAMGVGTGMPDMAVMQQIQSLMQQQQMWMQMLSQPLAPEMLQMVQQNINQIQTQIQTLMTMQSNPVSSTPVGGGYANPNPVSTPGNNPSNAVQQKDSGMRPDDPNRVVRYYPQPLFSKEVSRGGEGDRDKRPISLTEANAVANFVSAKLGDNSKELIVCFDIGGSTSDITALYRLRGDSGMGNPTMVKQNSLRFAAQRVSGAVRYATGFHDVLKQVCERFGLTILGLNKGENRYTPDTASYYFDQIVNLLSDEQLPTLYQLIAARTPKLMWVNMYVTGLLIYYGGLLTAKLLADLKRVAPEERDRGDDGNVKTVKITFAGKGSRLLQWLPTVYPTAAEQYYNALFKQGLGQDGVNFQIEYPKSENIKYEVSMGLAKNATNLYNPKYDTPSEIIGETGFEVIDEDNTTYQLSDINTVTPEMIESIGKYFYPTEPHAENFRDFCKIFNNVAKQLFQIDVPNDYFERNAQNLNISQYVQNLPEFLTASLNKDSKDGKFDFVAPIIMLEGMKFYDDYLLNVLK